MVMDKEANGLKTQVAEIEGAWVSLEKVDRQYGMFTLSGEE